MSEERLYEYYYRAAARGAPKKAYFFADSDAAAVDHLRAHVAPAHQHFELVALHQVLVDRRPGVPELARARGTRANPKSADRRALEQAAALFRAFREEEPGRVTTIRRRLPAAAAVMGDLLGVIYRTSHGGRVQKYVHHFARHAQPALLASADGRQLLIEGGHFRVNAHGIVDTPRAAR